ncbi:MAG: hypothetical protein ACW98K_19315 [Candidatus Kariarchaeaceae archaeon]
MPIENGSLDDVFKDELVNYQAIFNVAPVGIVSTCRNCTGHREGSIIR